MKGRWSRERHEYDEGEGCIETQRKIFILWLKKINLWKIIFKYNKRKLIHMDKIFAMTFSSHTNNKLGYHSLVFFLLVVLFISNHARYHKFILCWTLRVFCHCYLLCLTVFANLIELYWSSHLWGLEPPPPHNRLLPHQMK